MQWCVGLVTIAFFGCAQPAANSDPYCGNGVNDPYEECDTPGVGDCSEDCTLPTPIVTAHWQFVTLAGDSSDCLPGSPSVEISSTGLRGIPIGFSAPCAGGQATHGLKGYFSVTVTSMLDHAYATAVPFTPSPTGDLPIATIYSDAGDVRVAATGVMGRLLDCGTNGFASVAVQLDDSALTEMPCSQAAPVTYSLVAAGPHQAFATGYDTTHTVVAHAGPVDVTALAAISVDVAVPIAR